MNFKLKIRYVYTNNILNHFINQGPGSIKLVQWQNCGWSRLVTFISWSTSGTRLSSDTISRELAFLSSQVLQKTTLMYGVCSYINPPSLLAQNNESLMARKLSSGKTAAACLATWERHLNRSHLERRQTAFLHLRPPYDVTLRMSCRSISTKLSFSDEQNDLLGAANLLTVKLKILERM
jgi:hypothetical protein